jgi:hypothetical protein
MTHACQVCPHTAPSPPSPPSPLSPMRYVLAVLVMAVLVLCDARACASLAMLDLALSLSLYFCLLLQLTRCNSYVAVRTSPTLRCFCNHGESVSGGGVRVCEDSRAVHPRGDLCSAPRALCFLLSTPCCLVSAL